MQSVLVQHGSRSVTVYYEVQPRVTFWSASLPMASDKDCPIHGAFSGRRLGPDGLPVGLVASVHSCIDWLESLALVTQAG